MALYVDQILKIMERMPADDEKVTELRALLARFAKRRLIVFLTSAEEMMSTMMTAVMTKQTTKQRRRMRVLQTDC
jgi:hypothetical protein